jgi:hypothetical protein
MTKQSSRQRSLTQLAPQLPIVFETLRPLEEKHRAEVVVLLSRLLLQVASADNESEVDDDAS